MRNPDFHAVLAASTRPSESASGQPCVEADPAMSGHSSKTATSVYELKR